MSKHDSWRCQECGAPIGWLGRFFSWMLPFHPFRHVCAEIKPEAPTRQMFFIAMETDKGVVSANVVADTYDQAFNYVYEHPEDPRFNPNRVDRRVLKVYHHYNGIWWTIPYRKGH